VTAADLAEEFEVPIEVAETAMMQVLEPQRSRRAG